MMTSEGRERFEVGETVREHTHQGVILTGGFLHPRVTCLLPHLYLGFENDT